MMDVVRLGAPGASTMYPAHRVLQTDDAAL
jgi:hypothetical protein